MYTNNHQHATHKYCARFETAFPSLQIECSGKRQRVTEFMMTDADLISLTAHPSMDSIF